MYIYHKIQCKEGTISFLAYFTTYKNYISILCRNWWWKNAFVFSYLFFLISLLNSLSTLFFLFWCCGKAYISLSSFLSVLHGKNACQNHPFITSNLIFPGQDGSLYLTLLSPRVIITNHFGDSPFWEAWTCLGLKALFGYFALLQFSKSFC